MMQSLTRPLFFATLVVGALYMSGCTGIQTLPHVARGGDTITLAAGSAEGMQQGNLTVTYIPDDTNASNVDLTPHIRALFNVQPDPTSQVALETQGNPGTIYEAGHRPWMNVVAIDLPSSMPVGTGRVSVQCVPQGSCTYPFLHPHVNNTSIALEIIAGQGGANPLRYQALFGNTANADLTQLAPLPQVVVLPDVASSDSAARYGAATIVVKAPVTTNTGGAVPDDDLFVIAEDISANTRSQSQLNWTRNGDDFTVMLISPIGMTWQEARFSIVLRPPQTGSTIQAHVYSATPTLQSQTFYDLEGNVVAAIDSPQINVSLAN